MRKLLIFCCCLLLILTCLPAGMAATISGRRYEDFELCYADNLDFINQNTAGTCCRWFWPRARPTPTEGTACTSCWAMCCV